MKRSAMFIVFFLAALLALNACNTSYAAERDTVRLSVTMIATNIDPHNAVSSFVHSQILSHVYEPFFHLNDRTGEYEPRVATGYSVSDDGLVYTFNLREGVKFHNGEPLKASDAAFSIERAMRTPAQFQFTRMIEKAEAEGDYTVRVTLKYPFAPFLHSIRHAFILSEKAVLETGEANMASVPSKAGTGPYYITSYRPDVAIEYEAFADYYRGEASIKKIVSRPFTDTSTGLIAFENGEIDFYSVPLANKNEVFSSGKYNTMLIPQNHITYIRMNHHRGPLADIRVREAVALCVDREALNIISYEGFAVDAPKMFNPKYIFGAPDVDTGIVFETNIERAKQLLAEAGYPNGVDIGEMLVIAGWYFEKAANGFQAQLARAGIKSRVVPQEQSSVVTANINGAYDFTLYGFGCQFDYSFALQLIDFTKGEYDLPLYDDVRPLFTQAAAEQDPATRKALYAKIDDLLMQKFIYVPIFHRTSPLAWNKDLNIVHGALYYYVYDWSWK